MTKNNDKETKIIEKIHLISKNIDKFKLYKARELQIDYLANSIININNNQNMQNTLISTSLKLCNLLGLKTNITNLPLKLNKKGLIIISNHIGLNKLTKIYPHMIMDKIKLSGTAYKNIIPPLVNNDSFILLFAPIISAITSIFSQKNIFIIPVSIKFEKIYSEILKKSGAILLDRDKKNQYTYLLNSAINRASECYTINHIPIFIIFPEGGTSGKYNNDTPYSLLNFNNGYIRLANDIKLDILPLAVALNSESTIDVTVLNLIKYSNKYDINTDRANLQQVLSKYI